MNISKNTLPLSLGFSPCPNDTFIFDALVHNKIKTELKFAKPELADVEQLNFWAMKKQFDITKLSFHALGYVLDEYCVLQAGSALGRGCGPLLIVKEEERASKREELAGKKIAIPGRYTTAALLLKMFLAERGISDYSLVEMRFDNIMQAVLQGDVEAGVIIHESRFTYTGLGLYSLQDLGSWWEESTGTAIPLGCIAARRNLGTDRLRAINNAIKKSVRYAFANPQESLSYIQTHSQELSPEVVQSHIGLYVNSYSEHLGEAGTAAIATFLAKGRQAKVLPENSLPFMVP